MINSLLLLFAPVYSLNALGAILFLCCPEVDALALETKPEALRPAAKDPVPMLKALIE